MKRFLITTVIGKLLLVTIFGSCVNSDPLKMAATKYIENYIPTSLLNEKSYDPIEFGELSPIYRTVQDIQFELEVCKSLIEHTKQLIVEIPTSHTISYVPNVCVSASDNLERLGYFTIDNFVYGDSFFLKDHCNAGTIFKSQLGIGRGSRIFANSHGGLGLPYVKHGLEYFESVLTFLQEKKVKIETDIDNIPPAELIGYVITHKYNRSNQYGGIETINCKFIFNKHITQAWIYSGNGDEISILPYSTNNYIK